MSYYKLYKKYKQKYLNIKLNHDMIGGLGQTDKDEYLEFKSFYQKQVDRYNSNYSDMFDQYSKKCVYTPDIIQVNPNQKVYCLGDVHGDFDVLFSNLVESGLISENTGKWIGNNSILIQLGDMLDGTREQSGNILKYQDDTQLNSGVPYQGESKIVNYLKYLHLEAIENGGMVITCLGNHDISRLLAKYSDDGTIAERSHYHVGSPQYNARLNHYKREGLIAPSIGVNRHSLSVQDNANYEQLFNSPHYLGSLDDIGSASYLYMNRHNKSDFNNNKSLGSISNPNEYSIDNGYHRQLLASCASKLMVKLKWNTTSDRGSFPIGLLCSHGEKFNDHFLYLKYYIITNIDLINQTYGYNNNTGINTNQIDNNNDLIIIFINSIFSFFLRKYNQKAIDPDIDEDLFRKLIIKIVKLCNGSDYDQGSNSFMWGRPPNNGYDIDEIRQYCKKTADTLSFFRLDPNRSTCLSAHSGPLGTGIIPINESGVCKPVTNVHDRIHPNTAIMTDVMASQAFKTNAGIPNRGNPQLVKIYLTKYHSTDDDPVLKIELITSSESEYNIDTDEYTTIDIGNKYTKSNIFKQSLSDKIVNIDPNKLEADIIPDSTLFVGFTYDSDTDINSSPVSVYEVHSNRNLRTVDSVNALDQLQQEQIVDLPNQNSII